MWIQRTLCSEGVPEDRERMSGVQDCYRVSWDDESKIMRTEWLPGSVCGLEEAISVTADMRELGCGTVPVLVDMREMAKLERPAREHFAIDNGGVRAIALLASSPVTRMMANFFIGMRRMAVPIRMFTSESEAVAWLHGLV